MDQPRQELMDALSGRYQDGKYSDLTVVCGGTTYRVHKVVVCSRSPFFAKACEGPFQEAQNGIINLPEDDPIAVLLMMHYLYHLDYPYISFPGGVHDVGDIETLPDSSTKKGKKKTKSLTREIVYLPSAVPDEPEPIVEEPESEVAPAEEPSAWTLRYLDLKRKHPSYFTTEETNLVIHAKLYALAEKYVIEGLKGLALRKFKNEVRTKWATQNFLQATKIAYNSTVDTDRGLRDEIVETFHRTGLLKKTGVGEFIRETEDLVFDLLMRQFPQCK